MKVEAAVARSPEAGFSLEVLDLGEPGDDEILVRIVAVGVCHTDLVAKNQSLPFPLPAVLGHEGAGIVERVGSRVTKVVPGDHVVLTFASCGKCLNCQRGSPGRCREFMIRNFSGQCCPLHAHDGERVSGGFFGQSSFASHSLTNERNVVKVSKAVPLETLAPLGCGIQTGAGTVLNSLRPHAGSSIAIFGAGAVGLSAMLAAIVAGCTRIIVADVKPERLELAKRLGATDVINSAQENPVERVRLLTDGEGADYAVECSGIPSVMRQAIDAIAVHGACALVGAAPAGATVNVDIGSLVAGRTIMGVIEGDSIPDIFIPQLIELWQQGRFPFDQLLEFYDFGDINNAVEDSERGKVVKPVLRFSRAGDG
ncbi:NAD(P)-dependent alcohol dehydrogenase [Stenotrophomonas sp. Iso1]|uniref:NAD(P)-dependent alcohol dehydrogenase n=1 Tax=Stenotrophomonas sp. Iso1 TaxID=2977283 RepID=UPI0022B7CB12|nr:NAD(P)-dependent alcohol dehydrogenase [Stenotrophomonas sp. Iso1]